MTALINEHNWETFPQNLKPPEIFNFLISWLPQFFYKSPAFQEIFRFLEKIWQTLLELTLPSPTPTAHYKYLAW